MNAKERARQIEFSVLNHGHEWPTVKLLIEQAIESAVREELLKFGIEKLSDTIYKMDASAKQQRMVAILTSVKE